MPIGSWRFTTFQQHVSGPPFADQEFNVDQAVDYLGGTENDTLVGTIEIGTDPANLSITSGNTNSAFRLDGNDLVVNNRGALTSVGTFTLGMLAEGVGSTSFTVTVNVLDVWQPSDSSDCMVWGLADGSGDLVLTTLNEVTQATDKSGEGNHFVLPSTIGGLAASTKPIYTASVWNGRGMISFDGVNNRLGGGSFSLGSGLPTTGGMVIQLPAVVSANGQIASYSSFNGLISTRATDASFGIYGGQVNKWRTNVASAPSNHILVWEDAGTASGINMWLDGVQVVTNGAAASPETSAQTAVRMCLGGQFAGDTDAAVKIGEWCFFDTVDRTGITNKLIAHLMRWQSPLDQPGNEPPILNPQSFSHVAGVASGTSLYAVQANDPEGGTLTFSILSGNGSGYYAIGSTSGVVTSASASIPAGVTTLVIRATDEGALTTDANLTITSTTQIPVDGPVASATGSSGNAGTAASPYDLATAITQAKAQGKPAFLMDSGGQYTRSVTLDLTSSVSGITLQKYPGHSPIISGGEEVTSREQVGTASLYWGVSPSAAGVRPHLLEVDGEVWEMVAWRPAGSRTTDYSGEMAVYKAEWMLMNASTAPSASHNRGKLLSNDYNRLERYFPGAGQIWAIHDCRTPAGTYFKYAQRLASMNAGNEISLDQQFHGYAGRNDPILNASGVKFYNFAPWLLQSDVPTKRYAYAPSCGTLAYDAQSTTFVPGEKVVGQTSGATGWVLADVDAGTTGTIYLCNITGTWQDNENIRVTVDPDGGGTGPTTRAVANGTVTSKGNRIVMKTATAPVSRCYVPTLNRVVDIQSGATNITFDGISVRNALNMTGDPLANPAGDRGELVNVASSGFTFKNGSLIGGGIGIHANTGASGLTILNDTFHGCDGHCVRSMGGTSGISIQNCVMEEQRGPNSSLNSSAIKLQQGSNNSIRYVLIRNWKTEGIWYATQTNLTIQFNTFFNISQLSYDTPSGIYTTRVSTGVTILDNWFQDCGPGLNITNNTTVLTFAPESTVNTIYMDDGARNVTIRGNVEVSIRRPAGRSFYMLHAIRPGEEAGDVSFENNLSIHTDSMAGNQRQRPVTFQADGTSAINGTNLVRSNIFINKGTQRAGYTKRENSAPASMSASYNVRKNYGNTSGSFTSTNDISDPTYAIIVNENGSSGVLYTVDPLLASGTAQNLKLARGSGGIGWVEINKTEMMKAGLLP